MSNTMKDKIANAGHAVADTAKNVEPQNRGRDCKSGRFRKRKDEASSPAEGSDTGIAGVREHMDVIASCGKQVGVVDRVEGTAIKLTRNDSPDGQHHFIPTNWVERVDSHVHLKKNSRETEQGWKSDAASCRSLRRLIPTPCTWSPSRQGDGLLLLPGSSTLNTKVFQRTCSRD